MNTRSTAVRLKVAGLVAVENAAFENMAFEEIRKFIVLAVPDPLHEAHRPRKAHLRAFLRV